MSSNTSSHLELRGKTYYFCMRVPKEFADVEPLREINRTLKTRDRLEAEARCANVRLALFTEWRARRAGRVADTRATFDASIDLLKGWGMTFSPMDDLIAGPVENLLSRIEAVANVDPLPAAVPAALGAIELPDVTLREMAERMPILKANEIRAKNARQHREWCGNFKRGARDFTAQIGKRTILTISEQDATDYTAHWKTLSESGKVTTNYANKQIRYVRQMIDTHLDDIRMPDSKRINVFEKKRVKKLAYDPEDDERKKLPLPETWIRNRLIKDRVLEALEQEASDIAIISAIGGMIVSALQSAFCKRT